MKIGNVELENNIFLAPMAGVTDLPFRILCKEMGCGLVYSEMVSAKGILYNNENTKKLLTVEQKERPAAVQLFGSQPEIMAAMAKKIENYDIEIIDVNMGCPVKKVIKAGGGCSLLGDLGRIKAVVSNIRHATEKPFSIKIRIGLDEKNLVYKEILKIAENEGVNALVVHGRTKRDMFGGTVRIDILQEIADMANITVIGNGGVAGYNTYREMKATGVAGIMIGRSMMKAPWVFKAIEDKCSDDDLYNYLSPAEIGSLLIELWSYMLEHTKGRGMKETHYMHILKKFAVWFCKGFEMAADFRTNIYKTNSIDEVLSLIRQFYRC